MIIIVMNMWKSVIFPVSIVTLPFSGGRPRLLGCTHELYAVLMFGRRDRWALHHSDKRSSASHCEEYKLLDSCRSFALDICLQLLLAANWWEASQGPTQCGTQDILGILSIPRISVNKLYKYYGHIEGELEGSKYQSIEDKAGPLRRV